MKKIYLYSISTSLSTVTAEIYHEVGPISQVLEGEMLHISDCYKTFSGKLFTNSPTEQQLSDAKSWAIKQTEIMNKYQ